MQCYHAKLKAEFRTGIFECEAILGSCHTLITMYFRDPKVISSISAVTLVFSTSLCSFSDFFLPWRRNHQSFEASFSYMLPNNQNFFYCCDNFCTHKSEGVQLSVWSLFFWRRLKIYIDTKAVGNLFLLVVNFLGSCNHYLRLVPSYLHRFYCNSAS